MSDGMRRELMYLSSYATNRYFIPNRGKALKRAEGLLENWMRQHHDKDCYPPTIINITDGEYNGATDDEMMQLSNQLKSMFTNDGNVLFFNIHVAPGHVESVTFPATPGELNGNGYGERLYNMSGLLQVAEQESFDFEKDILAPLLASAGSEKEFRTLMSTLYDKREIESDDYTLAVL